MNKQLETYAAGATDLQIDLDASARGTTDHVVTPCVAGKRVVVRHNGYCHYYDKQPRKTAQWKNEQRRFRK